MARVLVVFGDQLDRHASVLTELDPATDTIVMVEASDEATREHSHVQRVVYFLSAMRHYASDLRHRGYTVDYAELGTVSSLEAGIEHALAHLLPDELHATEAGDYRCEQMLEACASRAGIPLTWHANRLVLCSRGEFADHARGRKTLRMEYFYREMRKKHGVLMDGGKPVGGSWNYDSDNRSSFPKSGPPEPIPRPEHRSDRITSEVTKAVAEHLPDLPGRIDRFIWPVTPEEAQSDLNEFIEKRLPVFGRYQDAIWQNEQLLYHSRISPALNTGLLDPREVIAAAETAFREEKAPIASVEGFIRQILGWREYIRGIYWYSMPDYLEMNELGATEPLPGFFWTGDTEMNCVSDVVAGLNEYAYEHHIQRLMVTGLYAMLLGVAPRAIHAWYMAMFVDSVEWVTLPNVIGMSQYADGGIMASKPYAATGKYIQRMSNYCASCRFDPAKATGEDACPFTTLYWDFLDRHQEKLRTNMRMALQVKNLDRKSAIEINAIREAATIHRNKGNAS
ncbi:MAG: cryptochrome/photolyase family protein [Spirochaetaceae bacterium]|nr:MAG: cryptochrome/photolyase family protein [Spirochaetaceae bacterium]